MEIPRERCLLVHDKLRVFAIEGNLLTFHARVGSSTSDLQKTCWNVYSEISILRIFTCYTIVVSFCLAPFSTRLMESCSSLHSFCSSLTSHILWHGMIAWREKRMAMVYEYCATSKMNVYIEGKTLQNILDEDTFYRTYIIPTWVVFGVSVFRSLILIPWTLLPATE